MTGPPAAVIDVTPPVVDLRGYRSDTLIVSFRFMSSYPDGDAWDYGADNEWLAQIRQTPQGSVLTTFDVDTSRHAEGYLILRLTPLQTAALPNRSVWDLQKTDPDSNVYTSMRGTVYLTGDVSR